MARRIEIELTSTRDDGSWTWRAAGAKQPKGVLDASLLPAGQSVGDVLRAEVETGLDGTEVISVSAPKTDTRAEPDRIELIGRDLRDDELVTSKLVGKRGRRDRDGDDRRGRKGRDRRGGRDGERGRDGDRGRGRGDGRGRGEGRGRDGEHRRDDRRGRPEGGRDGDRSRSERSRRKPVDDRPRPKRLRPQRHHRRAVLDTLEAHERPIAEEVLRGGIPAVRQAVEKQNEQARAEGRPEVDPAQLEALAERLLPRLRTAEWRDRADAALADIDELDLRDLRTVVVAADSAARDDEAREIAGRLRDGLERRIEADHNAWLAELAELLTDGRVVRALRVSSRPPKAGVPLPADLSTRLAEAASASLTSDTYPDRWETVLDALSLSPVHARVAPESLPAQPSDELKATVAGFGDRVPLVAQAFGVEPAPRSRRPRRGGRKGGKGDRGGRPAEAKGPQDGSGRPVPPPPDRPAADDGEPETTAATTEAAPATGGADGPAAAADPGGADAPVDEPVDAPATTSTDEAPAPEEASSAPGTDEAAAPEEPSVPDTDEGDATSA